ncbi:MAG: TspO/MBR family protein [Xenococcaceae cyanobacterium]
MIPSWLVIAGVTFLTALIVNRLDPDDRRWFFRLRRPSWLTFEWLIPFIWIFIFTCGAISANEVWQTKPDRGYTWFLMGFYLLWEISILAYTTVMCRLRSLKVGTIIGATGFVVGLILTLLVFPVSFNAACLLIPFLLWSPIGTFVTWQMIELNPDDA